MLPQVLEQQRALASMVQQMRLELVAYRRELVRDPDIARTGRSLTRWRRSGSRGVWARCTVTSAW